MAKESKSKRWTDACSDAEQALQVLIDIQADCQDEFDSMSKKAQEGEKGQALTLITDLDLQDAIDMILEAAALEIP